jgi:hypothetical protein
VLWFERGQFSIYVTLSYLWLFLGIIRRSPSHLAIAAAFSFVKWTSFPFVFVTVSLWTLSAKSVRNLKENLRLAAVVPLTILLLFCVDLSEGLRFLAGLREQEQSFMPEGISLASVLPLWCAKALPFALLALGGLLLWRCQRVFLSLVPYLAAVGILGTIYPTVAYDYSTPCLLCFVPMLLYWVQSTRPVTAASDPGPGGIPLRSRLRRQIPLFALVFFCVFVLVASVFHTMVSVRFKLHEHAIIYFYLAGATILAGLCALSCRPTLRAAAATTSGCPG